MDKDKLDGVAVFLAVAELASFTAAGARLDISASAVSKAIRVLEQRHGVPLFSRSTRKVTLTEAGAALFARLAPAVGEIDLAFEQLNGFRNTVSGTLRLSITRSACRLLIEPMLAQFCRDHPQLQLDITFDEGTVDLIAERYDAGIRLGEALAQDMVAVRLTPPLEWTLVASPAYFQGMGRPANPRALMMHTAITYRFVRSGMLHHWEFAEDGRHYTVDMPSQLIVNDRSKLLDFARMGLGLAYVGVFEAQEDLQAGRLEQVLQNYVTPSDGLYLYFPARTQGQAKLRALIDALKAQHLLNAQQRPASK